MLDDLEKSIVSLSEMVNEFVEKLDPVLQPEAPIPASTSGVVADGEPRSLVCNRVGSLEARVQSIRDRLSATFSRLDLP